MVALRRHIRAETYAVLGNHDCIEMVPLLEAGGIRMLLNEHAVVEHGGASIQLAGVDDPHYYETDNLHQALDGVPESAFKILLVHSPEICRKAAFSGVNLYLCGHTHAGQICLPGGRPLLINSKCPRECHSGLWTFEEMTGYTSRGAGTSSVDVRFNCPPEITVHTLRRKG
jgi:predicted MPP superfamily phosphohydrolase